MSQLPEYTVGGTIHLVVNNQVPWCFGLCVCHCGCVHAAEVAGTESAAHGTQQQDLKAMNGSLNTARLAHRLHSCRLPSPPTLASRAAAPTAQARASSLRARSGAASGEVPTARALWLLQLIPCTVALSDCNLALPTHRTHTASLFVNLQTWPRRWPAPCSTSTPTMPRQWCARSPILHLRAPAVQGGPLALAACCSRVFVHVPFRVYTTCCGHLSAALPSMPCRLPLAADTGVRAGGRVAPGV